MRRGSAVAAVAAALLALLAVPAWAAAAEYKVTKPSGSVVGTVAPGPVQEGADRLGIVRDLTKFRGTVYSRQSSSGYTGWPVSNVSSYVAWVAKVSDRRFLVRKVPWGAALGRVTKLSSGRWLAQKKVEGRWVTIGRVQKGSRGQWAAGAARLLLWRR